MNEIEGTLEWYTKQAESLIKKYGDAWMFKDSENIGLVVHNMVVADSTYNPDKGAKPSTWRVCRAIYAIKNIRNKEYKRDKQVVSLNHVLGSGKELWEITQDFRCLNSEEVNLEQTIKRAMLTSKQSTVIKMYIGGENMIEIADKLGVSKQRVSQVVNDSVKAMLKEVCCD
tara:strand:+ start:313 stop:825 length:513 start_codon:yes stop_codon:yes gene_type:complete